MAKHFVMRLNDGETYTNLEGCELLVFDEEPTDEIVKEAGIENLLAGFLVEDDKADIRTWKGNKQITLTQRWDP